MRMGGSACPGKMASSKQSIFIDYSYMSQSALNVNPFDKKYFIKALLMEFNVKT
jgi:hypothetical protein